MPDHESLRASLARVGILKPDAEDAEEEESFISKALRLRREAEALDETEDD